MVTLQHFSGTWTAEQRCQNQNGTFFLKLTVCELNINKGRLLFYFRIFSLNPYTVPHSTLSVPKLPPVIL